MDSITIEGESTANSPQQAERPDHIPEKFWDTEAGEVNVEAMAKSYSELERVQSKGSEDVSTEGLETHTKTELPESVETSETAPPLDEQKMGEYYTQYTENEGALPDASYAELEELGYSRGMVDTFIAGVEAQKDGVDSAVHTAAGGEDSFQEMLPWFVENLSAAEKSAYENAQQSLDSAKAAELMVGFKAKFEAANGSPPSMTIQGRSPAGEGAYHSPAEMVRDMRNPRYQNDPAFRQMVRTKITNSGPDLLGSHKATTHQI